MEGVAADHPLRSTGSIAMGFGLVLLAAGAGAGIAAVS